jgi:hypothetical protein
MIARPFCLTGTGFVVEELYWLSFLRGMFIGRIGTGVVHD